MTRQRILALVALVTVGATLASAAPARAHVAPSENENNRYFKVTLLPDRVRVSFTVFFGQRPATGERQRMDRDRDGLLSPDEAAAFGASLRDDVAGHLRLTVDDVAVPPTAWTVADVGLGTPAVRAGAFSVDLLAYLPTRAAGAHALVVDDEWTVPDPGEAELLVEESPGVRVVAAHRVADPAGELLLRFAFRGNPRPADDCAVRVEWLVDEAAHAQAVDAVPDAPAPPAAPRSHRLLWLALAACGLGAAALAWFVRRGAQDPPA